MIKEFESLGFKKLQLEDEVYKSDFGVYPEYYCKEYKELNYSIEIKFENGELDNEATISITNTGEFIGKTTVKQAYIIARKMKEAEKTIMVERIRIKRLIKSL